MADGRSLDRVRDVDVDVADAEALGQQVSEATDAERFGPQRQRTADGGAPGGRVL